MTCSSQAPRELDFTTYTSTMNTPKVFTILPLPQRSKHLSTARHTTKPKLVVLYQMTELQHSGSHTKRSLSILGYFVLGLRQNKTLVLFAVQYCPMNEILSFPLISNVARWKSSPCGVLYLGSWRVNLWTRSEQSCADVPGHFQRVCISNLSHSASLWSLLTPSLEPSALVLTCDE